jgi:outer membrane protein OmpA-like peptidoglycan-associated protein
MKKRLFLTLALSLVIGASAFAQRNYVTEANDLYNAEKYCDAVEKFDIAYKKIGVKQNKARVQKGEMAFKGGQCLRFTEQFKDAIDYFEKAIVLRYYEVEPKLYLFNGDMYRATGQIEKAKANYEKYIKLVPSDLEGKTGLASCEIALNFKENTTKHKVLNESKINTSSFDMAPMLGSKKGDLIVFSSSRAGSVGGDVDPRTCESYMDLWQSQLDKKGNWMQPEPFGGSVINTIDNEGTICFDGRAKVCFFTRCPRENKVNLGCEIWTANVKGTRWAKPTKMELKGHDSLSIGHPCVTKDGKFLIFAGNLPGGQGGRDLWYSEYNKRAKTWGAPVNMGPEINTKGNELFPTLGPEGNLYIASDGHAGMGGLDMFVCAKAGTNKWGKPANLGAPLNSSSNDYGVIPLDAKRGYFTSNRAHRGKDGTSHKPDIWSYELPPVLITCKVVVTDKNSGKPIANAKVKVAGDNGLVEKTTDVDGVIYLEKKPNDDRYILQEMNYSIASEMEGFYPAAPKKFSTNGVEDNKDYLFELEMLPKGVIRMPEVRYDLGKSELQIIPGEVNSKDSLNFLFDIMTEYPNLVVMLRSHTDCRGSDKANMTLSQARAQSCVDYLVNEKGLAADRFVAKGMGESEPLNRADYPGAGESTVLTCSYITKYKKKDKELFDRLHQYNRRTDFKVIRDDYGKTPAPTGGQ